MLKKQGRSFWVLITAAAISLACALTVFGQTFSEYWYQDAKGWHIKDGNGILQKNCWLCDDAVPENGRNIWYLIDANGDMIAAGLVQDGTGNYYSLEMNHDGYYGMLRYQSRSYTADGLTVALKLEGNHNGSFAAILNADGLAALKNKYGVKKVNIDNSNIVYTSTFQKAAQPQPLSDGDFIASGASVANMDVIAGIRMSYSNDAATYFYYDAAADPSKEGVVKTARGITLGSSRNAVKASYGQAASSGTCSDPAGTQILEIAYRKDPDRVKARCASYDVYCTPDGSKALMFAYDSDGTVSYIFYYLA